MKHIIYIISFFALFAAMPVMAQQANGQIVEGVVVDDNGEPIIGATVQVVGSKGGVTTDMDGKFVIHVPAKAKYRVSYIGYLTQNITPNGQKAKIVLKEDLNNLEEVVVVGYGSGKPRNATGSIEVVNVEELKGLSVSNLSEALIGLSSSIHVDLPSSGRPGSKAEISIRQASSATSLAPTGMDPNTGKSYGGVSDPSPLYVIDDFISNKDEFDNLDIEEIESLVVLKDAAAAIYGSMAAYGVIVVKTKRGKAGKPKISYTGQYGYMDAYKHADQLDAYNYGLIYNAAKAARVGTSSSASDDILHDYFQADELEAMKNMNYNLLDQYWSSAIQQRHSINVNGGNEKATYFASVSYYTEDGCIGKLDYDRWNYRAGISTNISKYVKASINLSGDSGTKVSHMASSGGGGSNEDYINLLRNPRYVPNVINDYPIYHSGMLNDPAFSNYYNYESLYRSQNNQEQKSNGYSLQAALEWDMGWWKPLQGLKMKLTYTKSVSNDKRNDIKMSNTVYRVKNRGGSGGHLYITDPKAIIDNDPLVDYDPVTLEGFSYTDFLNLEQRVLNSGSQSYLQRTMSRADSYQMNLMLIYNREFGNHNVGATFSVEKAESESENLQGKGTNPLSFTDGQSSSLSDGSELTANWGRSESGRLAYLGRVNYAYQDKYLAEFLFRSEASTKFSPENFWGIFPSISAGWIMSEEKWFPKEKTGIDFLKIRASWGLMGHDNVEAWRWKQLYAYNQYGGNIFGNSYTQNSSANYQLPEKSGTNPDLKWDKNYQMNFGIDMSMLNQKLSLTLEGYYTLGRDLFVVPSTSRMPGTVGIYAAPENYGQMDSWGVELTATWRQRIGRDWYYRIRLSSGIDDNKVLLNNWDETPTAFDRLVKGERTDRGLWGLSCLGIFRSYQEIEEYFEKYHITSYLGKSKSEVHPGMLIYEDVRGTAKDQYGDFTDFTGPDGVIDATVDRVKISNRKSNPYNVQGSIQVDYKQFELLATFKADWGAYKMMTSSLYGESFENMEKANVSTMWKDMYVYEDVFDAQGNKIAFQNRDARWPSIRYNDVNNKVSTFWKIPATQIVLHNITLSYTFPKKLVQHIGLSNLKMNVTCQNALSFYNPYPNGYWDDFAGNYASYPRTRKLTMGVNITF